jgi:hypothetical protein
MPERETICPLDDPERLHAAAVDAWHQAVAIREIVRKLAQGDDDDGLEWRYCCEALERLLEQLCEVLNEQLCLALLGPAAAAAEAARKAQEGHP